MPNLNIPCRTPLFENKKFPSKLNKFAASLQTLSSRPALHYFLVFNPLTKNIWVHSTCSNAKLHSSMFQSDKSKILPLCYRNFLHQRGIDVTIRKCYDATDATIIGRTILCNASRSYLGDIMLENEGN